MGRDGERKNIKIHLTLKIVLKPCVLDGRYPVLRDFVVVVLVFSHYNFCSFGSL